MTSLAHLKAYTVSTSVGPYLCHEEDGLFEAGIRVGVVLGIFNTKPWLHSNLLPYTWHFHSTASTVWLTGSVNGSVSLLMTLDITMICGPQVVTTVWAMCPRVKGTVLQKQIHLAWRFLSLYEKINSFNYTSTKI